MYVESKKKILILLAIVIFAILLFLLVSKYHEQKKIDQADMAEITKEVTVVSEKLIIAEENISIMMEFVEAHVPYPIGMVDVPVTIESDQDERLFPVSLLLTGLLENNQTMFMSAFSVEALASLLEKKEDYEKREEALLSTMQQLSRENRLIEIQTRFVNLKGKRGLELTFVYSDDVKENAIVQLSQLDNKGVDESFTISTPIKEILEQLKDK